MSLFQPESDISARRGGESVRSPFADVAGRFANWLAGVDHLGGDEAPAAFGADPHEEVAAPTTRTSSVNASSASSASSATSTLVARPEAEPDDPEPDPSSQFPLAPLGYNRSAVDDHIARLEREIAELRAVHQPAMSITEELEWIGEQTASILVVAHDKAHETTRRAQEQAERTVAEAASRAMAITEEARRRLGELDAETDQVWHERERLLDDVRVVSAALAELADEASGRFPAAESSAPVDAGVTVAFDAPAWTDPTESGDTGEMETVGDPQATRAFSIWEEAAARGDHAPDHAPEPADEPDGASERDGAPDEGHDRP